MQPTNTVVDFGCGTGRLAVHLIPHLKGGRYIGIDVSKTMLEHSGLLTKKVTAGSSCQVSWQHQVAPKFALPDASVDLVCAFSVFTHVEHEDAFRYLCDAARIVRPGGKFVLSCLPLSLAVSRAFFLEMAKMDLAERWAGVRNVVTTEEMMNTIASLAQWKIVRWYRGDEPNVPVGDPAVMRALGQSTCILERPA